VVILKSKSKNKHILPNSKKGLYLNSLLTGNLCFHCAYF